MKKAILKYRNEAKITLEELEENLIKETYQEPDDYKCTSVHSHSMEYMIDLYCSNGYDLIKEE